LSERTQAPSRTSEHGRASSRVKLLSYEAGRDPVDEGELAGSTRSISLYDAGVSTPVQARPVSAEPKATFVDGRGVRSGEVKLDAYLTFVWVVGLSNWRRSQR